MKVDPDGTLMSVISDKHDFLEKPLQAVAGVANKVPGVNMHPEIMEKSLVAVTPPMFANIKKIRAKQFKDDVPERAVSGIERVKKTAQDKETDLTVLERFASAKPSEIGVQAEQLKQAGMLSTVPALINNE
jgi:hypothetical protein